MVWYGMVRYGMAWYGMVRYGMVWYGMIWYGTAWYGMIRYDTVYAGFDVVKVRVRRPLRTAFGVSLTGRDDHPVAVDDRAVIVVLLRGLQAAALLHVADRLVPLPLALGAGPGSGQQRLAHIQGRG